MKEMSPLLKRACIFIIPVFFYKSLKPNLFYFLSNNQLIINVKEKNHKKTGMRTGFNFIFSLDILFFLPLLQDLPEI